MCCCKFPPSVGAIYFLLTFITAIYFLYAEPLNSIQFDHISIDLSEQYDDFQNIPSMSYMQIKRGTNLNVQLSENSSSILRNRKDMKIILRGNSFASDRTTMKTSIKNKPLCEIMDNYQYDHISGSGQKRISFCRVQAGFHEIYDNSSKFNDLTIPHEMLSHRTSQLELIRHGEKIACKQLQFINSGVGNRLWSENDF
ncbi:hypothetical protein HHI36_003909 [Cryptolaemus montrouzieri]|uniref:Uncharacterized protein n=1 Tax=Cryptolaemus montrouzieri TaxID=559131 RepID=A0ABD2NPM9_9CUCU